MKEQKEIRKILEVLKKKNTMKFILVFLILIIGSSCVDKTNILTENVKYSIQKELQDKNLKIYGFETEVLSLDLVHKESNEYVGILRTHEVRKKGSKFYNYKDTTDNDFNFQYDVNVVYDGHNFQYDLSGKRFEN
jgi:hypothetical protein